MQYITVTPPKAYDQDSESEQFREKSLACFCNGFEKFGPWIESQPKVKVLDEAVDTADVCHDYALKKILGRNPLNETEAPSNSQRMECVLGKYFTETISPTKGDLIVYYNQAFSDLNEPITHSGVVDNHDQVKSKWGSMPVVILHPTFYSLSAWGDEVRYFTPKI